MKRKLIISIISLCLILSNAIIVNASTGEANLTVNQETVKRGETFTVTLSATCADGINGISTKFHYDDTKLELVNTATTNSNWSSLGQGNEITVICNVASKITTDNIYVLTFKVKADAPENSTATISVEKIMIDSDAANDSEFTVEVQPIAVNIVPTVSTTIPDDNNQGEDNPKPDDNNQVGDNQSTEKDNHIGSNTIGNSITNTVKNTINNTNKPNGKLPQTGEDNVMIIILIGALGIAAISFLIRIKYINKKA